MKITSNRFGMFIALGITLNLIFYFMINVAYVIGFAPNTGLTMPFVSYGGTNTIFTLTSVGLLLNIIREGIKNSKIDYKGISGV